MGREIEEIRRNLRRWARAERQRVPWIFGPVLPVLTFDDIAEPIAAINAGESGHGAYHGTAGFDTFSHRRSVLRRPSGNIDAPLLNPPCSRWKHALVRKVL